MQPIYDIEKSYLDNVKEGPFFEGAPLKRQLPPKSEWKELFGHPIATPIGVPAGPLLTSKWIALAAKLGFDVPTYKTIRSDTHPAHPLPNMVYVDIQEGGKALRTERPPENLEQLAVTNSFGMPSMSPEFLLEDIARANSLLQEGQVMIVSVVGTSRDDLSFEEDFIRAALLAKEAGAKIIEANFSCPNVSKAEGSLYLNPVEAGRIAGALAKAIHPLPLIIKVGVFPSQAALCATLCALAKAGVRGFAGINTISMEVVDAQGKPAIEGRKTSGICGGPIRNAALQFMKWAHEINQREKLDLTLLGCGGITLPCHFDDFFEAGADIAMTATGMMWDPYLALKWEKAYGKADS